MNRDRDYSRLYQFLKDLSLRHQLYSVIEFVILLASGALVILLGSLFVLRFKDSFPYLPLAYSLASIVFLASVIWLGTRRIFRKPSIEGVARSLEKKFPGLKDDVTNSILLFREIDSRQTVGQVSRALVLAQLKKTVGKINLINPSEVVNLKKAFGPLRLLAPLVLIMCLMLVAEQDDSRTI